jgi:hypothetical protein
MSEAIELEREDGGEERLTDADLEALAQRRAASAPRDSAGYKRTGGPVTAMDPTIVDHMPCRRCRAPVEVTESGMDAFVTFERLQISQGQVPTPRDQVQVCDECRKLVVAHAAKNARRVCDRMAAAVRTLKAGTGGEEERLAIECLNKHDNLRGPDGESETVRYWREKHRQKRGGESPWSP